MFFEAISYKEEGA